MSNECGDSNVERLITAHRRRVSLGIHKYGVTTDRTDYSLRDWLQHALEESMDHCVYLNRAIAEIDAQQAMKELE